MTVTNAMRLLTQAGISFETSEYPVDESDLSGVHAAAMLGVDAGKVPDQMSTATPKTSSKAKPKAVPAPIST